MIDGALRRELPRRRAIRCDVCRAIVAQLPWQALVEREGRILKILVCSSRYCIAHAGRVPCHPPLIEAGVGFWQLPPELAAQVQAGGVL